MPRFSLPAAMVIALALSTPSFAQSNGAPQDDTAPVSVMTPGQVIRSSSVPGDSAPPPAAATASASGYSGYAGGDTAAAAPAPVQQLAPTGAPVNPAVAGQPPALPAGTAPVPPYTATPPVAAAAPLPDPNTPPDPCASSMSSNAAYVMCQDRMKKIQRMKDAKATRGKVYDPPPPPAPPAAAAAPPAADGKTPVGKPPEGAGLNAGTPAAPPATTTETKK